MRKHIHGGASAASSSSAPPATTAGVAVASTAHPVLTRPALLSHVFKFAARGLKDVKLLHVHSSWEDTAINYCP